MFTEKITFPAGILVGKTIFKEAVLEEETFGHTLRASSMPGVDTSRFDDGAYFNASVLAARLKVAGLFEARLAHDEGFRELVEEYSESNGVDFRRVTSSQVHPVSAGMIEALSRVDGRLILAASAILEKRRSDFRKEAVATEAESDSPPGAGVHRGGDLGQELGGSGSDT
jgi:sugar/nucleoside kinase (ribokinase family)